MPSSSAAAPYKLQRTLVERPWGGEIWFTAEPALPLLVKFIYTRQPLSFQVHPGDEYAALHHNGRGKTEMWYVVRAEPDSRIALGFREPVTPVQLREAALSGEIENLVNWVSPQPGDAFLTRAGTVHAIGAGIELWEIQQNSDITYRLFDYGRGRELHLDHAMNVIDTRRADSAPVPLPISSEYFHTDRIECAASMEYPANLERFHLLIVMKGPGTIAGQPFNEGEVWLLPPAAPGFILQCDGGAEFLRTWAP